MTKFLIIAVSLFLSLGPAVILAQDITEAINLDENIQPEDLGISEPTLLPDSPFYFLKNWGRGIQNFFTFNPVAKAELKAKFANEKLMEVKKLVELKKNPEVIKKASENYQQEVGKIKEQVEKIKDKAKESPQVESFFDKFIQQQTLHEKLLQRLETQAPSEAFEKIKEAREAHLERFQDVMLKLEDRSEKITEKLDKILEEQKGSQFKNFKNLEVLKNLEEKLPEEAKEAIQKAQENALKRLQGDLEKMSPEDQEKFKEYIEKISGEKEKHLEILENLKAKIRKLPETPESIQLREKLEEGKTTIFEKIEEKFEKLDCSFWTPPAPGFCKEGRVIMEKYPQTGCPLPPKCVIPGEIEIKEKKLPGLELGECGGKQGILCQEGYVCDCNTIRDCRWDMMGLCVKKEGVQEKPAACITLWDPVCGKDGKTYSNTCFAKLAGVEIAYKEECREKECKTDADCPQLRCAPEVRCIGVKSKCIEGKCQTVPIETPACKNLCGDGICQEVVCEAIGCPCAETKESCPADCKPR